jgi:hypothetical protein
MTVAVPIRKFGKKPATHDPRIARFSDRVDMSKLPVPAPSCDWYSKDTYIPMLGNDQYGDCVIASTYHYLIKAWIYNNPGQTISVSESDALGVYSAITGFNPAIPSTDQGTYVQGKGGLLDYWTNTGVPFLGSTNKVGPYVSVNFHDPREIKYAISNFGSVLTGATIYSSVMSQPFLWENPSGTVEGGHEFLICGYEELSANYWEYDIITWVGHYRCTQGWLEKCVDEMIVVIDPTLFSATGLDPSSIDMVQLEKDLELIKAVN